eukprot:COSAG06_NODE_14193_length_1177_cov_1.723404_2_plen_78_part_00
MPVKALFFLFGKRPLHVAIKIGSGHAQPEEKLRNGAFIDKTNVLPRQARDKHRENSKKDRCFCRIEMEDETHDAVVW